MKIRSKKSGKVLDVSNKFWKNMKAAGAEKVYEIVPEVQPVIQSKKLAEHLETKEGERSLPSREQMLTALREKGIRTAPNIGEDKLIERYQLNI